jgi:hypothetical protein
MGAPPNRRIRDIHKRTIGILDRIANPPPGCVNPVEVISAERHGLPSLRWEIQIYVCGDNRAQMRRARVRRSAQTDRPLKTPEALLQPIA